MSFTKLKADELALLATEGFAVEVPAGANKTQIIAALSENGITWEQALQSPFLPEAHRVIEVVPAPAPAAVTTTTLQGNDVAAVAVVEPPKSVVATRTLPEKVLLRMDRENPRYEIRGYKFTKEHPFALVDEANAEFIVENIDGFRFATPKEAREFYG